MMRSVLSSLIEHEIEIATVFKRQCENGTETLKDKEHLTSI